MSPINSEILIGCQDYWISKRFGHANEAGIRQTHGNVGIFLHQLRDWLQVVGKLEGNNQRMAAKQRPETRGATLSEKVVCLRKNRFAR